jgi:hypothetical protein
MRQVSDGILRRPYRRPSRSHAIVINEWARIPTQGLQGLCRAVPSVAVVPVSNKVPTLILAPASSSYEPLKVQVAMRDTIPGALGSRSLTARATKSTQTRPRLAPPRCAEKVGLIAVAFGRGRGNVREEGVCRRCRTAWTLDPVGTPACDEGKFTAPTTQGADRPAVSDTYACRRRSPRRPAR